MNFGMAMVVLIIANLVSGVYFSNPLCMNSEVSRKWNALHTLLFWIQATQARIIVPSHHCLVISLNLTTTNATST